MTRRLPRIGITPDEGLGEGPHGMPRFELKKAYAEAVLGAGGLPLVLPYSRRLAVIQQYLAVCEGLLVTGGAFDVSPELYGEAPREGLGAVKPERTEFERMLVEMALDRGLPLLGICGGMQLLNVVCGGTLYQDIEREIPNAKPHEQKSDRRQPAHEVAVAPRTLLERAVGPGALMVNTTHHQAVRQLGQGLVASAVSPDGVIEAIEAPERRFVVGVQWHPELLGESVPRNIRLYSAFVAAAGEPPGA